jgi:ribosomal protein S18 acetylase RimI-like enzyme
VIRTANLDDLPSLRMIEWAAGEAFRGIGMAAIAEDEPLSTEELAVYQANGRAWVATDDDDHPVAYILARTVDSGAHIDQVSVHPNCARRGIGATLIETVCAWAKEQQLAVVTLTTFAEVPWNAPYYRRLGFSVVPEAEITDGLRRISEDEAAHGLSQWPRVVMRRPLAV